ncbi:MAG: YdcF family protein [Clostridiales bacterium]|nr:YdcF family protein [Clostridiales bacterium]
MLRKAAKQIIVCALGLILLCVFCRLTLVRTYTARIPLRPGSSGSAKDIGDHPGARLEKPDVMHLGEMKVVRSDYISVPVHGDHAGDTNLIIYDSRGDEIAYTEFHVSRAGTVVDLRTGGFTGDTVVLTAVTLFWLAVSAIMIWHYFQAKGPAYYAYSTVYFAGFSLFSLVTGLLMLRLTGQHILHPEDFSMYSIYGAVNGASKQFMTITLPVVVAFAAAMAVSNIALLRHEGRRPQNALGLLVSAFLILGEMIGAFLFLRDFSGSEWEGRVQNTLENVYATIFVYFECMLAGSVICGITAARRQPEPDKDFIVILGCWFRPDGTLPPLLRGRVDRAVSFWRMQKERSGKEAIMIPSGGQGQNEPMAEAEAMRRYLITKGIPQELIRPETESRNTYQNMEFSKRIIQSVDREGKTVFATTNYHVFRSGVWAGMAGLPAEGIGGKTKWWFWPNAFMRECAGLLQKRWKQEILLLVLLIAWFSVLSLVLELG